MSELKIIECPRDAMQGITEFIPTELKIEYLNQLLKVGFDTLDFGSFVSPRAIPQLADTKEVMNGLKIDSSASKLLAIVANLRGAEDACLFPEIKYIGFPFSISETFQIKNTRKTIPESFEVVKKIQEVCISHSKELIIYISMGFGNPYGDPYSFDLVVKWVSKMNDLGVKIISLADTLGSSQPEGIATLFNQTKSSFPELEIGAHFHSTPKDRLQKISAAWDAGCRRFDVTLYGFGGCPFAEDELVGNISTESLLEFIRTQSIETNLNEEELLNSYILAQKVFSYK